MSLHRLSVTIANLVSLLNPRMVVLGGGVSRPLSPFLDILRTNVRRFTPIRSELMLSAFLERAGIIALVCAPEGSAAILPSGAAQLPICRGWICPCPGAARL